MKKLAAVLCGLLGVIVVIMSISARKAAVSIGIIGGADGPTSIFVAGKIGTGSVIALAAVGVCLILAAIWIFRKKKG